MCNLLVDSLLSIWQTARLICFACSQILWKYRPKFSISLSDSIQKHVVLKCNILPFFHLLFILFFVLFYYLGEGDEKFRHLFAVSTIFSELLFTDAGERPSLDVWSPTFLFSFIIIFTKLSSGILLIHLFFSFFSNNRSAWPFNWKSSPKLIAVIILLLKSFVMSLVSLVNK